MVLDSNIVIAAMNGHVGVSRRLASLRVADVGIPVVVLAELLYGAHRSKRVAENLERIGRLRDTFALLAPTESTAQHYGKLRADLVARGLSKSDFDLLIACAALESEAVLVTHDSALTDGSIPGLVVEDWLAAEGDDEA